MRTVTVADVMTRCPVSVRPDTPFRAVAALLAGRRISAVPVVDDRGAPVGVVSESGREVALVEPLPKGWDPTVPVPRARTTIVVADPNGTRDPVTYDLRGNYEPEASIVRRRVDPCDAEGETTNAPPRLPTAPGCSNNTEPVGTRTSSGPAPVPTNSVSEGTAVSDGCVDVPCVHAAATSATTETARISLVRMPTSVDARRHPGLGTRHTYSPTTPKVPWNPLTHRPVWLVNVGDGRSGCVRVVG